MPARYIVRVNFDRELVSDGNLDTHHLQQRQHRRYVIQVRHVFQDDRLCGQQRAREYR